tara:strand:- start:273 stop:1007 length:735 start_codon:yes stop_codon:yes gene_type:complete
MSELMQNEKIQFEKTDLELLSKSASFMVDDLHNFENGNNGNFSFKTMDVSHVCLLDLEFKQIEVLSKFGFQADQLKEAVKSFDNDLIDLEITKDKLILSDDNQRIEIKNLGEFSTDIPLPKLDYTSNTKMKIKEFYKVLRDFKKLGCDFITLESNEYNHNMKFSSKNDDGLQYRNFENVTNCIGSNESNYSIEYALGFMRILATNKAIKNLDIQIEYSSQKPLKLSIPGYKDKINFYLAPRVEY